MFYTIWKIPHSQANKLNKRNVLYDNSNIYVIIGGWNVVHDLGMKR